LGMRFHTPMHPQSTMLDSMSDRSHVVMLWLYDREHYFEPILPVGTLGIRKSLG
jgi:hypothetical protein